MNKINTFILAGGNSTRFKEDKTLYNILGKPMIEYCIRNVYGFSENIYIVAKNIEKYKHIKGVKVIQDIYQTQTPLSGIYTACCYSNNPFLIVGADMPFVQKSILDFLIKSHKTQATIFEIDGFLEPLLSIYDPNIKDIIKYHLDNNMLSVNRLLNKLELNIIKEPIAKILDKYLISFFNINTKEDLEYSFKIFEAKKDDI